MLASRLLFEEFSQADASRDVPQKRGGPQLGSLGTQVRERLLIRTEKDVTS